MGGISGSCPKAISTLLWENLVVVALPLLVTNIHHILTIVETSLTTQRWSHCWSAFVWLGIVYSGLTWLACLALPPLSVRNSQTVLLVVAAEYLRKFWGLRRRQFDRRDWMCDGVRNGETGVAVQAVGKFLQGGEIVMDEARQPPLVRTLFIEALIDESRLITPPLFHAALPPQLKVDRWTT